MKKKILAVVITALMGISSTIGFVYASDARSSANAQTVAFYKNNDSYKTKTSADHLMAAEALGLKASDYDLDNVKSLSNALVGTLAKKIIVLAGASQDLTNVNGVNLISTLEEKVNADGSISGATTSNTVVWVVNALYVVNSSKTEAACDHLAAMQESSGGYQTNWGIDTTGWVLQTLSDVDRSEYATHISKINSYLLSYENESGLFTGPYGACSNTQATVLMGYLAYDEAGVKGTRYNKNGVNPYDAMLSYQLSDGSFGYLNNTTYNDFATGQSALTVGCYENGDFLKNIKADYASYLSNQRTSSYKSLKSYYSQKTSLTSCDEYLSAYALDLDPTKMKDATEIKISELSNTTSSGDLAKAIIYLLSNNKNPKNINGKDIVSMLESQVGEDGTIKDAVKSSSIMAWDVYALYITGSSHLSSAATALAKQQASDHSYGYYYNGYNADLDTTGWVLGALALSQSEASYQSNALSYLLAHQNDSALFAGDWGASANTQASVLLGILAYDESGVKGSTYNKKGTNPYDALIATYQDTTGAFTYYGAVNDYATNQAAWTIGSYENGIVFTRLKAAYKKLNTVESTQEETVTPSKSSADSSTSTTPKKKASATKKKTSATTSSTTSSTAKTTTKTSASRTDSTSTSQTTSPKKTTKQTSETSSKPETKTTTHKVNASNPFVSYGLIGAGVIVVGFMALILFKTIVKKD